MGGSIDHVSRLQFWYALDGVCHVYGPDLPSALPTKLAVEVAAHRPLGLRMLYPLVLAVLFSVGCARLLARLLANSQDRNVSLHDNIVGHRKNL